MLTSADPQQTIKPKFSVPTIDKKITAVNGTPINEENGATTATAVGGDTVTFKVTSAVPDMRGYSSYKFIIHDTMDDSLTYDAFTSFKINGNSVATNGENGVTLTANSSSQDITLTINDLKNADLNALKGQTIELVYTAKINEKAAPDTAEKNTVYLEYSNNPYAEGTGTTPKKVVKIYDFSLDVLKHVKDHTEQPLQNATFVLFKEGTSSSNIQYYKASNNGGKADWTADQLKDNAVPSEALELTTNSSGNLSPNFNNLPEGTYYLKETKAPDGYNLLDAPVKVTITLGDPDASGVITEVIYNDGAEHKVSLGEETATHVVNVANSTGTELPETGGIGTTIFYIVGGALMIGALVLLLTKKKMANK